jgi:hypothetical protein
MVAQLGRAAAPDCPGYEAFLLHQQPRDLSDSSLIAA